MRIAVSVESTNDMTIDLIQKYDISVVPFKVSLNSENSFEHPVELFGETAPSDNINIDNTSIMQTEETVQKRRTTHSYDRRATKIVKDNSTKESIFEKTKLRIITTENIIVT